MGNRHDAEEQLYLDVVEIFTEVCGRQPTGEELVRLKGEYETLLHAYGRGNAIKWLLPKVRRYCNE